MSYDRDDSEGRHDGGPAGPPVAVVGASHRTAPIEVRERFHLDRDAARAIVRRVREGGSDREAVPLSTCNRIELYLHGRPLAAVVDDAREAMIRQAGLPAAAAAGHLYVRRGREGVRHLFEVVAGLDSMVVGEAEIQGQVGDAYAFAHERRPESVGPVLHRLFQQGLAAGGDIRAKTRLGEGAASVPSAAVDLASKVFGSLEGRRALVVGAGAMGRLTVQTLRAQGVRVPMVTSRTTESARRLAREVGGEAVPFDGFPSRLGEVEIVVSCTAASRPVLTVAELREVRGRDDRAPLVILDIAVPRDVAPEAGDLPEVFLYNVDDLQRVVERTARARREEVPRAAELIEEAVDEFCAWYRAREAVPLIRAIRGRAERLRDGAVEEALAEIEGLAEEEKERIRGAFRLVLNRFLHAPTVQLRELAASEDGERYLEAVRRLFRLDDELGGEEEDG